MSHQFLLLLLFLDSLRGTYSFCFAKYKPTASPHRTEYKFLPLNAYSSDWQQTQDSEDGMKYAHDEITYRVRSGEILNIPQAERYSTRDWIHNLCTIPSSRLLKRIRGVVVVNALWSVLVYVVFQLTKFSTPGIRCHSLLGSALGLLLVFRTNTAYNRFWEGRKIWELVLTKSRSLGSFSIVNSDSIGRKRVERICHLICAFPIVLQEHLQGFHGSTGLGQLIENSEIEDLERVSNKPYFIASKLAREIRQIDECVAFSSRDKQYMMSFVDALTSSIGSAERIVQTPVPLTYARHTSRFLSLFCLSAPVALVGEIGLYIVPFGTFMTWALFGILEIGMMIEEPFQRALKLEVFANTIRRDLSDMIHVANISPVQLNITSPSLTYEAPFYSRADAIKMLYLESRLHSKLIQEISNDIFPS